MVGRGQWDGGRWVVEGSLVDMDVFDGDCGWDEGIRWIGCGGGGGMNLFRVE